MKDAKEKAKELFDKFSLGNYHAPNAKQCALIAVDEILNAIEQIFETFEERKYWQEVKKEIEKL
jgi:hypothetical protein